MIVAAFLIRTIVVALVFRGLVDPGIHFGEFGAEIGWTARSLATGHGYTSPFFPITGPTALVPPGYTFLLAIVFRLFGLYTSQAAFVILTLNSVFSALTCVPIYLIARDAISVRIARRAGWAWVLYPFSIYYSAQVWEYALTALLFTTCLYILSRLHAETRTLAWAGFGLLFGITALVNPAVLTVLPFLFLIALWKVHRTGAPWLLKALVTTLAVIAPLAPWTVFASRSMHTLVPLRDGYWLEFYAGNNGDTFESNARWAHPATNQVEMQRYKDLGETSYLAEKRQLAVGFVRRHPLWFAAATMRRFLRYWTGFWSFSSRYLEHQLLDVPNTFFCSLITLFMLRGMGRLARINRTTALEFGMVLAIFPITYYLSHASMDYREPIEPIIAILAILGIFGLKTSPGSLDASNVVLGQQTQPVSAKTPSHDL